MKRSTVINDRLATAVVGAAVTALGAACAAWQLGRLSVPAGSALRIPQLDTTLSAAWWPYALAVTAVVLIGLGVRWLFAHRPRQTVGTTELPNSSSAGDLTLDVDTAASAAAAALSQDPYVASASGTSRVDRGQRIVELDVKLAPDPGALAAVTATIASVRQDLANALVGVPVTIRVLLRTARDHASAARVA